MTERILVATGTRVLVVDPATGGIRSAAGLEGRRPTCLAAAAWAPARAWCGTRRHGVMRTEDGGESWQGAGTAARHVTALSSSPASPGVLWAGMEPSQVWVSRDEGGGWARTSSLDSLPSSSEWSFPPRPETHHVRWIAAHPAEAGRLWVAVEAGALVTTRDGGGSWQDRVPGGPRDTHELALHPARPDALRVAAGDGYFESHDGGATWSSPSRGLEVSYLRSIAIDPGDADVVLVSAASRPRAAYVADHPDGRLYRREGGGSWERVVRGWPDVPSTIAPLLARGAASGEVWAADERGLHRSDDGGSSWGPVATFDPTPANLRGLVVLSAP
jgi:photosystem II stability/assembly factor-like uncharacterized protein